MAQDEFLRPPNWPPDQVSAFFKEPAGLVFGAIIPKGRYLNISLLGRDLTRDAISDFIVAQGLNTFLPPPPGSLCGCTPRIAVRLAKRYYGKRWIAIGDAAVTRLYKDGIGSAFSTAQKAMETAVRVGISRHAFRKAYAPFCRQIARDNIYGRLLFRLWFVTLRIPALTHGWVHAIQKENELPRESRIHGRVLWGMFTGDEPYRDIFWLSLSPQGLASLWRGIRRND
jgi:hypothetical protein